MFNIRPRGGRTLGFTLVELLVVIGVLTILMSILMPAIQNATASAKETNCISNLRQLAQVVVAYSANFPTYFPSTAHADTIGDIMTSPAVVDPLNNPEFWDGHLSGGVYLSHTWRGKVVGFVGAVGVTEDERYEVYKCPSVRRFNGRHSFYGSNAYVTMHYNTESLLYPATNGRKKYLHFDQIDSHTDTFMLGENNTGHWAVKPLKPRQSSDFSTSEMSKMANIYARHRSKSCWVFFDGSAKAMTIPEAEQRNCYLWFDNKAKANQ